jgi:hypothetical protein
MADNAEDTDSNLNRLPYDDKDRGIEVKIPDRACTNKHRVSIIDRRIPSPLITFFSCIATSIRRTRALNSP